MKALSLLAKKNICALFVFLLVLLPVQAEKLDARNQALSLYFSGDLKGASELFTDLALTGDSESQYYLGLIYSDSQWNDHNYSKAYSYLLSAADQNNSMAMWKIGELYDGGIGLEKDLLVAMDWYRKSKQVEFLQSRIMFLDSENNKFSELPVNSVIQKLIKDAELNDVNSQFRLATIYDHGNLTKIDSDKAYYWFKKAAENDHAYAMFMVGYMLCRGIGVEVDKLEANNWIKKSGRVASCH